MDRESFLETIAKQYADEIRDAYLECEHDEGRQIDFPRLNSLLAKLLKNALAAGLTASQFDDLVKASVPEAWSKLSYR